MDSDRINRWITLGANFGVLIGIILLIIEIQQNTEMMQAQLIQSRTENRLELYKEEIHSDYWPAIEVKRTAASSPQEWIASLTPEETQRVKSSVIYELNDLRAQFLQYRSGYLDEQLFKNSVRAQAIRAMRDRQFFPEIQTPGEEFVEFLNTIAHENDLPTID